MVMKNKEACTMKRLLALIFVVILFPVVSLADHFELMPDLSPVTSHYSVVVDGTVSIGKGGSPFDFDSLCIDLYLTDSDTVGYVSIILCKSGNVSCSGLRSVDILCNGESYYFTDSNGFYVTAQRDENGTDYWINYTGKNFRLRPVPEFSVYEDWK
jgi:hypothetical protein